MDVSIPSTFQGLLVYFASVFSSPSFDNFVFLVTGWILCPGRHVISRVIQYGSGTARDKHHSAFYRFFSRAVWEPDALSRCLVPVVAKWIPGDTLLVSVDDTLCRKSGPHLWGAGMHHDACRSTYGRGTSAGRKASFSFGHSWVLLCLWVPLPWNTERGIAIPVLFRLYRSKKLCPKSLYRKRSELALEMLQLLISWLPEDRKLIVTGDQEYACKTVIRGLSPDVHIVGPMPMDAAVYELPPPHSGSGRPRKKGKKLPNPAELAADTSIPWRHITVRMYGKDVEVMVKTQVGLRYNVCKTRLVRMVLTRDPGGRIDDRAYFSTDHEASVEEILAQYSRRWPQEQTHRDLKQHLGFEDPQNGWWRRHRVKRRTAKKPGPQPDRTRGCKAVQRTVPLACVTYATVILWYFQHGSVEEDLKRARENAPWYRQKENVSFADILQAARLVLWAPRVFKNPDKHMDLRKVRELLPLWLTAA